MWVWEYEKEERWISENNEVDEEELARGKQGLFGNDDGGRKHTKVEKLKGNVCNVVKSVFCYAPDENVKE